MKTNKLITILMGALLSFPACRETEWDRPEHKDRYIDVSVTLGQFDESEDGTRSIVDIEIEHFQKAALFAFDAMTGELITYTPGSGGQAGEPVAIFPQQKNFSWHSALRAVPLPNSRDWRQRVTGCRWPASRKEYS